MSIEIQGMNVSQEELEMFNVGRVAIADMVESVNNYILSDLSLMCGRGVTAAFPEDVIVIGCGGTGSWLAPKLIKIFNDAISKRLVGKINLTFIDGDEVEDKNLIRQNFVAQDIGKNKAEAIATRYGNHSVSNLRVSYIDKYIIDRKYSYDKDYADKFCDINKSPVFLKQNLLIINLIDNAKTRKMIHEFAATRIGSRRKYVIDVANNEYNGQLTFSDYTKRNLSVANARYYNQLSEQLLENDDISVFSCADADAENIDQMFNANDFAATIASNYINEWIVSQRLKYGRIDFVTGSEVSVSKKAPFFHLTTVDYIFDVGPDILEDYEEGHYSIDIYESCIKEIYDSAKIGYDIFIKSSGWNASFLSSCR